MKLNTAISILLVGGVFVMAHFVQSCSNSKAENTSIETTQLEIPQLLNRPDALGSVDEQVHVAQLYDKAVAKIQQNEKDANGWLELAEIFVNEARITGEHPYYYPAALNATEQVLSIDSISRDLKFRGLNTKALIQLALHQFEAGLETGKKAVELNPYNAGIYGALVDANVELGRYEEAVQMSDKMVSIRPDLRSYSRISYLREIHGDIDGAIEAMDMAVKAGYPGYEQTEWCRLILGGLYENHKNDLETAEMYYRQSLAERPDYPFAIAAIAEIQLKKGDIEGAEANIRKAIDLIPEVGFYGTLADIHLKKGETAEAEKIANEMVGMMKEDADAGHNMDLEFARLYLDRLNNAEKALEYAMKEYQVRPENIDVNKELARIYLTQENKEKAKMHLQKAMKTGTKDSGTLAMAMEMGMTP